MHNETVKLIVIPD